MTKTTILIVTHQKDFPWLAWCLRSIEKFASGFERVCVAIPEGTERQAMMQLIEPYYGTIPITFHVFDEWPNRGFLCHEYQIICSDLICPEADFILHLDADCIFCEPVTPDDYFVDGKPVLLFASYDWIVRRFNNKFFLFWKAAVEKALGGVSNYEFMRRHPAVHYRELYALPRLCIERNTNIPAAEYICQQKAEFPHGFAEFNTLGEVAWRGMHARYHWINQETQGRPHDKLIEFWSHGPMDKEQELTWTDHPQRKFVPLEVCHRILA